MDTNKVSTFLNSLKKKNNLTVLFFFKRLFSLLNPLLDNLKVKKIIIVKNKEDMIST